MSAQWVPGMVHPDRLRDATLRKAILAMIDHQTPQTFAAQIRALLDRPDASELLRTVRCPTLLVCRCEDAWSPLERHVAMQWAIEGSRLEIIEHCGHMSAMEQPQAVAAVLRSWLESHP